MKVSLDAAQVPLGSAEVPQDLHSFTPVSAGSLRLLVSQSTHDIVLVLQHLSEWRGWRPRAPRRAVPPRRTMRSQKVGGFEGGRLVEILHPSGTLGFLVATPQVCLQCFTGLKKGVWSRQRCGGATSDPNYTFCC